MCRKKEVIWDSVKNEIKKELASLVNKTVQQLAMVRRETNAKTMNTNSELHYIPPMYVDVCGLAASHTSSLSLKSCYRCWVLWRSVSIRHSASPQLLPLWGGVCNGNFASYLNLFLSSTSTQSFQNSYFEELDIVITIVVSDDAGRAHWSSQQCFVLWPCFAWWHFMVQGSKFADQTWKLHNFINRVHVTPAIGSLS